MTDLEPAPSEELTRVRQFPLLRPSKILNLQDIFASCVLDVLKYACGAKGKNIFYLQHLARSRDEETGELGLTR